MTTNPQRASAEIAVVRPSASAGIPILSREGNRAVRVSQINPRTETVTA
jgi:hypothetical protein